MIIKSIKWPKNQPLKGIDGSCIYLDRQCGHAWHSTHSQSAPLTQPQSHTPRVHAGALLKKGHPGTKEGPISPSPSPSEKERKHISIFLHDI